MRKGGASVQYLVRVDGVIIGFAHLPAVAGVHESMREDLLWQRELRAEEHTRPDDTVEPHDILADHMHICRPEPLVQYNRVTR